MSTEMPLRNDSRQPPSVALGSVINPCILVALFGFSPKNLKLSSLRSDASAFSTLIAARLLILLDWKSSNAPTHNNWVCDLMSCGFGTPFFPLFSSISVNVFLFLWMFICIDWLIYLFVCVLYELRLIPPPFLTFSLTYCILCFDGYW